MIEDSKDQDNNIINVYSDYEHEAESMVKTSIKNEEKKKYIST